MSIRWSTILLVVYLLFAALFYRLYASRSLSGQLELQMFADSLTYEGLAQSGVTQAGYVSVGLNILGPMTVLTLFRSDRDAIFLFNCVLFLLSYIAVSRNFPLHRPAYLVLLFLNPMLLFSLFAVNKEILGFAAISFFLAYLASRRWFWLASAIVLGVLSRWQLALFFFLVIALESHRNPLRPKRLANLALVILGITVIYPLMLPLFATVNEYVSGDEALGMSGIFPVMVSIQNHFGYFLVVIPKTAHFLFGILSRFGNVFAVRDFWDDVVVMFESVSFLVLTCLLLWGGKWRRSKDLLYLAGLYSVVFALSPVYSPRYFFCLYPICALLVALTPQDFQVLTRDDLRPTVLGSAT
jgi:hypothetical protein